jgi:hypothetical protein
MSDEPAPPPAERWREVWRAAARLLSRPGLLALRDALAANDQRLLQGGTTTPPPLLVVAEWPVEAACALAYCGWQGDGLNTVSEVEEFFARMCAEIDRSVQEAAGCRWFLNWFDETPRPEMIAAFLPEVELALQYGEVSL